MQPPEHFTEEQKARYEWALAEFNRIQERNTAPGTATTIAPAITPLIKHAPNPKSRLFARLLEGKAPLPFPPPTTYSNPWYDLVEDGFSDKVFLDGFVDLYGKGANTGIFINQCVWNICRENAAASELRAFRDRLKNSRSLVLTPQESGEAKIILRKKPEWIIKHGRNREFRLYLCRVKRQGKVNLLMTDLLQRDFSGGNPVLVERLANVPDPRTAHKTAEQERLTADWVRVECDGWCLEVVD
jgi:hypothetical protein